VLDYRYRFYDPQIGRFNSIDQLAEKYAYKSPYDYAENNPTTGIDLDGLEYECPTVMQNYGDIGKPWLDAKSQRGQTITPELREQAATLTKMANIGTLGGAGTVATGVAALVTAAITVPFLAGEASLASDAAVGTFLTAKDIIANDALTAAATGIAYSLTTKALDIPEAPKLNIPVADMATKATSLVTGFAAKIAENSNTSTTSTSNTSTSTTKPNTTLPALQNDATTNITVDKSYVENKAKNIDASKLPPLNL
jgi:hypothetical protein